MNRKRLIAMGIIMTLSMSTVACGKKEEKTEISKVAVEVENPTTGELTNDTTYIGTVEPQQQVYVTPKVSGTVTAAYFEVGDTVKEGDVLFKIDDEAAQLQMKSAEASYSQAQAGVTAATSGSRDLQNYQTEEQIRQLKEKLSDADDSIDDMEDDLDKLREQKKTANSQVSSTQTTVDQLTESLGVQNEAVETANKELEKAKTALEEAKKAGSNETSESGEEGNEETSVVDTSVQEAAVKTAEANLQAAQNKVEATTSQLAIAKQGLSTAQAALNSIESGKTQLKSGIEQLKDGKDTIQDNLNTAEQTYSITQNEVYPETDATYAAQLQAASVGVDSAKMQLDFYTVKAPISGVVEAANVKKEDMAAAGNPAYIISNKDSMTVTFNVTEKAKNTMNVGDHVTVERNGETFDGTITEIGTMAGQQTKLFQVKATIPGAGDKLPNGVSVKVSATTEKEDGSTLVPFDALYFSGGDAYVYCVVDNKLVRTSVTVGLMDDDHAIIEDGLDADSLVVSNWSSKLRNGADAEIVSLNGESVASPEQEEEATEDTPADAAAENEETDNSASDEEAAE
ncbi:efflux RND transporter periplasmic adaptor subunit [Clostridiaceae bacterium Marseille-Q4143]|nr:efflux RND transporter periplasmic adaptor subunit [Clostridiaceae bacterium Marseille-Q4143]